MNRMPYTAEPIIKDSLEDIRILIQGKTWHLWGRKGVDREIALAQSVPKGTLPVLIGSGMGHCLKHLLDTNTPVAVVDREEAILSLTDAQEQLSQNTDHLWVDDHAPRDAWQRILTWQEQHGGLPLTPIIFPLYLRLDREYYGALAETIKAGNKPDFWSQAKYPKFQSTSPKVLFFDSNYFLCKEILSALTNLGIEHRSISLDDREKGSSDFIKSTLSAVVDFKPDFVLTVNHFGLDREGKLAGLLADLGLPLASWFVDNPHLILFDYAHPGTDNTAIFTFDAGNLDQMRTKGFNNVHYLPLATDPNRFKPGLPSPKNLDCEVSFVGNSMTTPVAQSLQQAGLPAPLAAQYQDIASAFGHSGETMVARYLMDNHPAWAKAMADMPTSEKRLACESLLTWEATRQYRLSCVQATLPFSPTIVGDENWLDLLPTAGWKHIPRLDYYDELPGFYQASKINFNCTSQQMKGAVNQRVFDVPACGGFLLTDHREQMDDLFDLETEAVVYRNIEEIPDLIEKYLIDNNRRESIARAARARIVAKHTYEVRLESLLRTMKDSFTSS